MADTIVNTPASNDSGSSGWAVAIIILIAVIAAGFFWYRYYGGARATPDTTNINVSLPIPTGGNTAPQ